MGINAGGVVLIGLLSDYIQRHYLLALVYLVRGVAFVSLIVLPGAMAMWAFALIGGASWLATVPLTTGLTADVYGVRNVGMLGGLINFSHQMGGGAAVLLFGLTFDRLGTYDPAFAGRCPVSADRRHRDPDDPREEILDPIRARPWNRRLTHDASTCRRTRYLRFGAHAPHRVGRSRL